MAPLKRKQSNSSFQGRPSDRQITSFFRQGPSDPVASTKQDVVQTQGVVDLVSSDSVKEQDDEEKNLQADQHPATALRGFPRVITKQAGLVHLNVHAHTFKRTHNPTTRSAQFAAFKDNALLDKIKGLALWEQMQELSPWFDADEVMATYLKDDEKLHDTSSDPFSEKTVSFAMIKMGFPEQLACEPKLFANKTKSLKERIKNAFKFLKNHTPLRINVALPPNLANSITTKFVKVTGPLTREYTVIAESLPLMNRKPTSDSRNSNGNLKTTCTLAKIELFHDKSIRQVLATRTWARLRILDPTLRPWNFDETIATTNPHVLDEDHTLHQCFPAFWTRGYTFMENVAKSSDKTAVYCRDHECYEEMCISSPALLLQLGAGVLDEADWT